LHHFPWLNDSQDVACLVINTDSNLEVETLATLVIKKVYFDTFGLVGQIGLVCVKEKFRGYGFSALLMNLAYEYGKRFSLKALVLWTSKPEVYEKAGYVVDGVDYFGSVKNVFPGQTNSSKCNLFAQNCNELGVPAFATEVVKYSAGSGSITVCNSSRGPTLVDYSGDEESVIEIIKNTLPESWYLNSNENSYFVDLLKKSYFELDLKPSSVRMVLFFKPSPEEKIPYIGILNRI